MKLTSPSGPPRRASSASRAATSRRALTTEPGFTNPNRQQVVASTGAPSATRNSQTVYRMHCNACTHEYGCNGLDIKARLCPKCQGGVEGEPLRESAPMFDFSFLSSC